MGWEEQNIKVKFLGKKMIHSKQKFLGHDSLEAEEEESLHRSFRITDVSLAEPEPEPISPDTILVLS